MILEINNTPTIEGIETECFHRVFEVSLTISGLLKDNNMTVLAVVCGADSSRNPIMLSYMDTLPKFFFRTFSAFTGLLLSCEYGFVMCSLYHLVTYKREYIELKRYKGESRGTPRNKYV